MPMWSRFTVEQILRALRQAEGGSRVADIRHLPRTRGQRSHVLRLEEEVFGTGLSELRELRQLREENSKLKHLLADLLLDRHILPEIVQKKAVRPRHRRELGNDASSQGFSRERGCLSNRDFLKLCDALIASDGESAPSLVRTEERGHDRFQNCV
jgi:putative transposase